jgi:hypothetical protein
MCPTTWYALSTITRVALIVPPSPSLSLSPSLSPSLPDKLTVRCLPVQKFARNKAAALLLSVPKEAEARVNPRIAALVSVVRLRYGTDFLFERLEQNQTDGFQTGLKLLLRDTNIKARCREAAAGASRMHPGLRVVEGG